MAWSNVFTAMSPEAISARTLALSPYNSAANQAQGRAMGAASAFGGGGNAALAARQGVNAGTRAASAILGQRAAAEGQMIARDRERAEMEIRAEQERQRNLFGNLLTGAGQIAGMVMPALAPAAGAASALTGAGGGSPLGAVGGLLGPVAGALGGQPQRALPQQMLSPATQPRTLGMVDQALAAPGPGATGPDPIGWPAAARMGPSDPLGSLADPNAPPGPSPTFPAHQPRPYTQEELDLMRAPIRYGREGF
jgi:hypothetical protein